MAVPVPTDIKLHQQSHILEIHFNDEVFELSCEYLRVYSPSAEVRGHGPGQEVLQVAKEQVNIKAIEPTGNYAIKLVFDDGHDSGLYTWELLHDLGSRQDELWQDYSDRLKKLGYERKTLEHTANE